jgi:hypothetical protein
MTEERSIPYCAALGARAVFALDSAFRLFVLIRVHSWLKSVWSFAGTNRLIAEPAGCTEPGGGVTIAFVRPGRRVGEPGRSA